MPVTEINVGNIHNADGKEKVHPLHLRRREDKAAILAMADKGIKFNTKTTPSGADGAAEVDIVEFCRK